MLYVFLILLCRWRMLRHLYLLLSYLILMGFLNKMRYVFPQKKKKKVLVCFYFGHLHFKIFILNEKLEP